MRDHPISDLTDNIGILLDKDGNGDVNLAHVTRNLPPYIDDGTLTQEEADMYVSIVAGALEQDGADYKGNGSVMLEDV